MGLVGRMDMLIPPTATEWSTHHDEVIFIIIPDQLFEGIRMFWCGNEESLVWKKLKGVGIRATVAEIKLFRVCDACRYVKEKEGWRTFDPSL